MIRAARRGMTASSRRVFRAALTSVFVCGCGPAIDGDVVFCDYVTDAHIDQGIAQVRRGYGETFGWTISECAELLPITVDRLTEEAEFPDVCERPDVGTVVGCATRDINGDYHIWVLECLTDPVGVVAHEQLHIALWCDQGDPEGDHDGPAWDVVAPR